MIGSKLPPVKPLKKIPLPFVLIWAAIGLSLTVASTFLQPHLVVGFPPVILPIATTLQVGAVFLTGCLGGRNAGLISQLLYVGLGLSGAPIFFNGGGVDYLRSPAIGYIFGLIPGAWICGLFAFLKPPSLERLTFSCISGLIVVHLVGMTTIVVLNITKLGLAGELIWKYSGSLLLSQLVVVCATVVFAKALRWILLY